MWPMYKRSLFIIYKCISTQVTHRKWPSVSVKRPRVTYYCIITVNLYWCRYTYFI